MAQSLRHPGTIAFAMTENNNTKSLHPVCGVELDDFPHADQLRPSLETWVEMMWNLEDWGWKKKDEVWAPASKAPDIPWWYNERASVSHFAGAIWKNKGWVTEEFVVQRSDRAKTSEEGGKRRGRCDISFEVEKLKVIAEAKQAWPPITRPRCYAAAVRNKLMDAAKEIRELDPDDGYERYAIVFASPYVTSDADTKTKVNNFIEAIRTIEGAHAVAWAFPLIENPIQSPRPGYENRYFPGVALVMSRVDVEQET